MKRYVLEEEIMQEVSYDLNNPRYQEALRQAIANVQLDDVELKNSELKLQMEPQQFIKRRGAVYDRGRKI